MAQMLEIGLVSSLLTSVRDLASVGTFSAARLFDRADRIIRKIGGVVLLAIVARLPGIRVLEPPER